MAFTNITGGEPFIRRDIPDIVRELYKKSDRIVISTNGYFTDRITAHFNDMTVRIFCAQYTARIRFRLRSVMFDLGAHRNFGHSNTARFVSVRGRKIAVLKVNAGRLRCRKTVPLVTGLNGSFTAVKRPFYHSLQSENAV